MPPSGCKTPVSSGSWASFAPTKRKREHPQIVNERCCLRVLLSMLLALASLALQGQTANVAATAHAVDEHYNHLASLKGAFTEIYKGPGASRSESGTLWLKKPGRMRWEYREPREKLFLTDSENAYFYVPGDPQARRASL